MSDRLEIMERNLGELEKRKEMYGPGKAPLFLLNQIAELQKEIEELKQSLQEVQPEPEGSTGAQAVRREYLARLRQVLVTRLDEGELRTFCFDLGVDYDVLRGGGKADKARELIAHLEHRNRIPDLVQVGRRLRPDISW
jgi:hypothetical protein